MEGDAEQMLVEQQGTECLDSLAQTQNDENTQKQSEVKKEGNGVCEDRNSATAEEGTTDHIDTDTQKNVETAIKEEPAEESSDLLSQSVKKTEAGTHRAGFDAFMTGFIFAHSCTLAKQEGEGAGEEEQENWLPAALNKVYLSGKAAPLNIVKSTFAKSSKAHVQKMEMVWGRKV